MYYSYSCIITVTVVLCISSMDSSVHPNTVDVVSINMTNDTCTTQYANYIPGTFVANSVCFRDVTQQETYYLILVNTMQMIIIASYYISCLHAWTN